MIKTLNDFISLIALLVITFLTLRFFIGSLISKQNENETHVNRLDYLSDYINNEED